MLTAKGFKWEFLPGVKADQFDQVKSLRNQARVGTPLNEQRVDTYAESMKRGDKFPPVVAHGKMGKLEMADVNRALTLPTLGNSDYRALESGAGTLPGGGRAWSLTATDVLTACPDESSWELSEQVAIGFLGGYRGATAAAYRADLADLFRWAAGRRRPPLLLLRLDLDSYVQHLVDERSLASATVRRRLAAVHAMFGWAVDEQVITSNPASRMRRPRASIPPPRCRLTRPEMQALLRVSEADGPRSCALVHMLLLYGSRVGAVLQVDVEDVYGPPDRRLVALRVKGGGRQDLRLTAVTAAVIEQLVEGRAAGPLLRSRTGRRWDRTNAARTLRRLAHEVLDPAVADRIHPHCLRRAFVDCAVAAGIPLSQLQEALGHRTPAMTLRYAAEHGREHDPVAWQVAAALQADSAAQERADREPVDRAGQPVRVAGVVVPGAGQRHDERVLGRQQLVLVEADQVGVLADGVQAAGAELGVAAEREPAVRFSHGLGGGETPRCDTTVHFQSPGA
jgi:integrase/recombinase XerD